LLSPLCSLLAALSLLLSLFSRHVNTHVGTRGYDRSDYGAGTLTAVEDYCRTVQEKNEGLERGVLGCTGEDR
jgi:hypothetical protein